MKNKKTLLFVSLLLAGCSVQQSTQPVVVLLDSELTPTGASSQTTNQPITEIEGDVLEATAQAPNIDLEQCIGSFETFAFNEPLWGSSFDVELILPLPPWEQVAVLPGPSIEIMESGYYFSNIIGFRTTEAGAEIWISRQFSADILDPSALEFLIYTPSQGRWELVSGAIQGTDQYAWEVFVTEDGTIWGISTHPVFGTEDYTIIARFDEPTRQFVEVHRIPISTITPVTLAFEKNRGELWLFLDDDAAYSYNFHSTSLRRVVDIAEYSIGFVQLSDDGNIYFHSESLYEEVTEGVFKLETATGNIIPATSENEMWPKQHGPYLDSQGRLWLGAFAFREPSGEWHTLHPDPTLYAESLWSPTAAYPYVILESSNGLMWFGRGWGVQADGIAHYDPTTGKGCWFTTEHGNLIEDEFRTLWLVVRERLFMYQIP